MWCDMVLQLCVPHLSPAHTDDAVHISGRIVEKGHGDCVFTGRQPVAFRGRVDLEDMSSGTEDGLLPLKHNRKQKTKNKKTDLVNLNQCNDECL